LPRHSCVLVYYLHLAFKSDFFSFGFFDGVEKKTHGNEKWLFFLWNRFFTREKFPLTKIIFGFLDICKTDRAD